MTIKDAIDQGLYPKDGRGRQLVPMRNGQLATIYATDFLPGAPIVGSVHGNIRRWSSRGTAGLKTELTLLPLVKEA